MWHALPGMQICKHVCSMCTYPLGCPGSSLPAIQQGSHCIASIVACNDTWSMRTRHCVLLSFAAACYKHCNEFAWSCQHMYSGMQAAL
jgi:hypothetical protein